MATILDPLVGSCLKKLQEIVTEKAILVLEVKEELRELQGTMNQIRCFLNDAEQRRTDESAVNNWLGELRDAMYDADDIIDQARFEGNKLLEDRPSSSRNSTACTGISFLSCFPNIQRRHEIAVKIRNLNTRIEKISKWGETYGFMKAGPVRKSLTSTVRESSNLIEPNLVGKEIIHASRKLVELVLAHKEQKAYKLAIVGTGGVGKTTLAQKIYNDQKIKGNFNKRVWICVSQEYSKVSVLKQVLRNIGGHAEQDETIGELHSKVESAMEEKSFFLVLDDVWQSNVWTDLLRTPLHAAARGAILVTTRHDTIALEIGVEQTHRVDLMSVDVGWELLWKSMNINEEKEVQNLRGVGVDIVRKYGGLPLAIRVIARVLASKDQTESEWKKILSKNAWSMSRLPNEIRGALYLSYDDLPQHLKQCFLYCTIYREDWTFSRDDLVRLWVAEGFIDGHDGQLLENTVEEYYYELIRRNLLQPEVSYFDQRICKMHDLLRQLSCYLSRDECFIGDPESLGDNTMCKLRRIFVVTEKDMVLIPSMNKEEVKVRTFRTDQRPLGIENTFFKRFTYLRVLDLTGLLVESIPDYVENLIHLRLLDLDGTNISCLPESIGSLKNLQILNLQRCDALHRFPLAITKLYNLRRLGLDQTPINQVLKGIGKLISLNVLEGFPIGGGSDSAKAQHGWKLEELAPLSQMRQLGMIKLERAVTCNTDSVLIDKEYLKVLDLQCTEHTHEPYSEEDVSNIQMTFEQLIPPHNLEDLSIIIYFGRRYPTWLGTTNLSSVKQLNLIGCKSCVHLPPIGQLPNLKYLKIVGATAVTKIGPEFSGCGLGNHGSAMAVAFPKLELLIMGHMPNWEEWSFDQGDDEAAATEGGDDGAGAKHKGEAPSPRMQLLPRLSRLHLVDCPKLRGLPRQLGEEATSLRELLIRTASCLQVVENFPFLSDFLSVGACEGLERVSNLPLVSKLSVRSCPNLRSVEDSNGLRQLWLAEDMQQISSLWMPGLQQQHRQLYGEDLDVNTWLPS